MTKRSKFVKFLTVSLVFLLMIVMCALLVACNLTDDNTGDATTDEGGDKTDGVFDEDATMQEISDSLDNSKSYTFELKNTKVGEAEPYYIESYFITENAICLLYKEYDYDSDVWYEGEQYVLKYDGEVYYATKFGGEIDEISKDNTNIEEALSTQYLRVVGYLTEKDGFIVPDETKLKKIEDYVEGSAKVELKGSELNFCYTTVQASDNTSLIETYTLKGVDSTEVTVPEDIINAVQEYVENGEGETNIGDNIFTEDATLQKIADVLRAAESMKYQYTVSNEVEDGTEDYVYQFTRSAYGLVFSSTHAEATVYSGCYYGLLDNDILYTIEGYNDEYVASKDIISNVSPDLLPEEMFLEYIEELLSMLTEIDGKVSCAIDGTELILGGNYISFVSKESSAGGSIISTQTYSFVNVTQVDIPSDIRNEMQNAQWSSLVNYNNISYEYRSVGSAQFYWYSMPSDYNSDGVVPEETINGMPAIGVNMSSEDKNYFTEGMNADEVRATIEQSSGVVVEFNRMNDYGMMEERKICITPNCISDEFYYYSQDGRRVKNSVWVFRHNDKVYRTQILYENGYWEPLVELSESEREEYIDGIFASAGLNALEFVDGRLQINSDEFLKVDNDFNSSLGAGVGLYGNEYRFSYYVNSNGAINPVDITISHANRISVNIPANVLDKVLE